MKRILGVKNINWYFGGAGFVSIMLSAFLLVANLLAAPSAYGSKARKSRVLVLDFVNVEQSETYGYLSSSIADALVGPLKENGNFFVIERELWQQIKKKKGLQSKIQKRHNNNNNNNNAEFVSRLGRFVSADIVVYGSFSVKENRVILEGRAQFVQHPEAKISTKAVGKTDSTIFTSINSMASKLALDMDKDLSREKLARLNRKKSKKSPKRQKDSTGSSDSLLIPNILD